MTKTRLTRSAFPLAAVAVLALAACQPQGSNDAAGQPGDTVTPAATASAPAAAPTSLDAGVANAFLQQVHGASARLDGEWKGAIEGGSGQASYKVCAHQAATVAGQPSLLLAVCGTPDDFGHASGGLTDFYLVQVRDGQPVAAAKGHFDEFGSMGSVGDVKVQRFGADAWGFVVDGGFTGQGYTVGSRDVLLPKADAFVKAASFRSGLDNDLYMEGCKDSGDCEPVQAFNIVFDYRVDDSDPAAALWPILVRESGTACGKPANAEHRLVPDAAAMRYTVPVAAMREGC